MYWALQFMTANAKNLRMASYWVLILLCCLFSQSLFALRCGNWLVNPGDSTEDIYEECGEPDFIDSYTRIQYSTNYTYHPQLGYVTPHRDQDLFNTSLTIVQRVDSQAEIYVEVWSYRFRKGGIPKTTKFNFENGYLSQIEQVSRRSRRRWRKADSFIRRSSSKQPNT